MFQDRLSDWGDNRPSAIYDNFEFGSTAVPEATSLFQVGPGLTALGTGRKLRKQ